MVTMFFPKSEHIHYFCICIKIIMLTLIVYW